MSERTTPDIEDLEERETPCFLWDSGRLRIVWANAAGLEIFAADTLFDLIDRPFHTSEPGAARIAELGAELEPGSPRRELLSFPSTGEPEPIAVTCFRHRLADGRPGVLVVGQRPAGERRALLPPDMAQAFAALPVAALLVEADGAISQHNRAAAAFIGHLEERTLAELFGDAAAAMEFAHRLRSAGTLSHVRAMVLPIGRRDVRMVAGMLDGEPGEGERFAITLEDVTERRALERSLSAKPRRAHTAEAKPVPPSPEKGSIIPAKSQPADLAAPPASIVSAPEGAEEIPDIVRARFETSDEAVFIVRGGEVLHANELARSMLGFGSVAALRERRDIGSLLESESPVVVIADANGAAREVAIAKSEIPWLNGPAIQVKAAPVPAGAPLAEHSPPVPPAAEPATQAAPEPKQQRQADPSPLPPTDESWRPDDRELRAILDTASDGIVMLDGHGHVRSFSAGAEALFGQLEADVIAKPFENLLTPETRKIFRDYLSALADSGLASVFNDGREVEAIAEPGGSLPLFLTLSRFNAGKTSRAGAEQPFCAVVRDITQWKKTEAELRQAKDEAERTSAQKSEFLARISHELRTPLNAILGFSEVMLLERFGRIQNEKYRSYVDDIHTSGGHLLSLINDLLDLSKVEAGRLELNFTSVDLSEVVDHAVRSLAEQAQQARVAVRKNLPADLPSVVADARSMRQIMLNLLSNAVKFTDPGGQVTISARLTKGESWCCGSRTRASA